MLLTASRASPRARVLQSASSASSATLIQSRCARQTRELCFGAWSMHTGREGRRRHHAHRYHYLESLSRNVSWDKDANKSIKKAMAAFARGSEMGHGKAYINPDEVKSWSDEISSVRPGKNIEDVERSAIDHLIQGGKPLIYEHGMWKSQLQSIRNYLGSHHGEQSVTWRNTTEANDATFIDPITNRRRAKNDPQQPGPTPLYNEHDGHSPTDFSEPPQPFTSSQNYKDLGSYGPVRDENISTEPAQANKHSDLDRYKPVVDDVSSRTEQKDSGYQDLDKYSAVHWNEPDGLRKATPEETSKEYQDLDKYSSTKFDDPFTPRTLTPEEQSKFYDDLDQYKAVEWNEPDGLQKPTAEELSKNYDDLHKYGAVHWNEPDGLRKPTPEELSKNYTDLAGYGPVVWSEPDGLRSLTPEEESKKYEDLDSYDAPFVAEDSILRAHEISQMDATPRGKPLPAKVDAPVEDLSSKYDDLDQYGPVKWNEPDGLRKLTPEELSKNYDDLHLYGAVKWNEPDGLRELTPEEKSKQHGDGSLYAPRDLPRPEVNAKGVHPKVSSNGYKDLPAYHHYDNADPETARIHPEEASKVYKDLDKYEAYPNAGPAQERIHPEQASKNYNDLDQYPAAGFEEAVTTKHVHPEELTKQYEDLDEYQPTSFDAVESPYTAHPEEPTKVYEDLNRYTAVHHNEPDGKPASKPDVVARGLKEYDSKAGPQDTRNGPSVTYPLPHRNNGPEPDLIDSNTETLTAEDIRAATLRRAYELSQEHKLEESGDQASSLDVEQTTRLTGNYARDFPEEFSTSWNIENSPTKSTLFPKDLAQKADPAKAFSADRDGAEMSSMDECFPREEAPLQTSLDRYVMRDPYSHDPQGLETSFKEECGKETMPTVEKHYTSKNSVGNAPELYRILAYDATSQTMSIADATTSVQASDSTSSLGDVLLRLSNPSKFLPHFESLQAQGYEVVSGSGDVLIFRKVRSASAHGESITASTHAGSARVNPIDLMGRPAVGNFASPTGFVNYETLANSLDQEKPAPPFRPAVETKEEETIAARAPAGGQRKKRRLGRKLVLGTAGVAGSAYTISALGEHLSTREARRAEPRPKRT